MALATAQLGLDPFQQVTADRIMYALNITSIPFITQALGDTALLARDKESGLISTGLPNDQWKREVRAWYETALALMQKSITSYADAPEVPEGAHMKSFGPSAAKMDAAAAQCTTQRVRNTGSYQSFSFVGVMLIVCIGSFVILLPWVVERFLDRKPKEDFQYPDVSPPDSSKSPRRRRWEALYNDEVTGLLSQLLQKEVLNDEGIWDLQRGMFGIPIWAEPGANMGARSKEQAIEVASIAPGGKNTDSRTGTPPGGPNNPTVTHNTPAPDSTPPRGSSGNQVGTTEPLAADSQTLPGDPASPAGIRHTSALDSATPMNSTVSRRSTDDTSVQGSTPSPGSSVRSMEPTEQLPSDPVSPSNGPISPTVAHEASATDPVATPSKSGSGGVKSKTSATDSGADPENPSSLNIAPGALVSDFFASLSTASSAEPASKKHKERVGELANA